MRTRPCRSGCRRRGRPASDSRWMWRDPAGGIGAHQEERDIEDIKAVVDDVEVVGASLLDTPRSEARAHPPGSRSLRRHRQHGRSCRQGHRCGRHRSSMVSAIDARPSIRSISGVQRRTRSGLTDKGRYQPPSSSRDGDTEARNPGPLSQPSANSISWTTESVAAVGQRLHRLEIAERLADGDQLGADLILERNSPALPDGGRR